MLNKATIHFFFIMRMLGLEPNVAMSSPNKAGVNSIIHVYTKSVGSYVTHPTRLGLALPL